LNSVDDIHPTEAELLEVAAELEAEEKRFRRESEPLIRRLEEARQCVLELEAEIASQREQRTDKLLDTFVKHLRMNGLTPKDVQEFWDDTVGAWAAAPALRAKTAVAGKKLPAKYRDPKTGDEWSGRGSPAAWIKKHEAAGGKRDDFLVL
jgi:DNA-binding protein H-NS